MFRLILICIYQDKLVIKHNMAKNDRFIELYLKKVNGRVYVLLPRVVLELLFTRKLDRTHKQDLFVMSFSYCNDMGDWFETVGTLHFYRLRFDKPNVTLQKRLCRICTEFCSYEDLLAYVKTYPGITRYLPRFVNKIIKNAYTTRLFNKLCKQNGNITNTNKMHNSYFKLA